MNKGRAQGITRPCNTVGAHLTKVSLSCIDPVLLVAEKYRRFILREVQEYNHFQNHLNLWEANQYNTGH